MDLINNKRLYKYDNLKFFLIVLVILGHISDICISNGSIYKTIFVYIFAFHMPLFVFLVGLFQKKLTSFKEIPFKKIAWYIFLVYFMKIIAYFLSICFNVKYYFSLLGDTTYSWFLWAASFYIIITPLINKFKLYPLLIFSIILAAFTGYDKTIGDTLHLSRIIVFFPYYLSGYILNNKKENLINFCKNNWLRIAASILLLTFSYICIFKLDVIYPFRGIFTGRNSFAAIKNMTCTFHTRLIAYTISFLVSFAMLVLVPSKKIPIISKCGTRTLQVYVLHKFILITLNGLGFFNVIIENYTTFAPIIFLIFSLLLALILSLGCIEKLFNYIKIHMFNPEKS